MEERLETAADKDRAKLARYGRLEVAKDTRTGLN